MIMPAPTSVLPQLYEADETAWLEAMSRLIGEGRWQELDYAHLGEYLADMARRDKREVVSRLSVLIAHRFKWDHQPRRRSRGWRTTIEVQRQELAGLLESGVLRSHAVASLPRAFQNAVRQVAAGTGLPKSRRRNARIPWINCSRKMRRLRKNSKRSSSVRDPLQAAA